MVMLRAFGNYDKQRENASQRCYRSLVCLLPLVVIEL